MPKPRASSPPEPAVLTLAQLLFSQGFGTRRECDALIHHGALRIGGSVHDDPDDTVQAEEGFSFEVEGRPWSYHARALLMLHKPAGYECSQKPSAWPSVMTLLPPPLRRRGVQAVGRLDQDTTGLLLLTDDGTLLHKLTSPKHHVPKVYEATCAEPVAPPQLQRLLEGVVLHDDPKPVRAAAAEATGECTLRLTLTEGKYHQVKRMLGAVGNRVDALHRSAVGALQLPADLLPGQWRWVEDESLLLPRR
jgi:16S rRNA pseudouridine516 synthase